MAVDWLYDTLADDLIDGQGDAVGRPQFDSPADVARLIYAGTVQTPALDIIDAALVAAVNGTGPKRLIISMPPQEGKSQRVSRYFPTWLLSRDPTKRIALIGYQDAISRRWGRQIRNDVREHGRALKLAISGDTQAANEWTLVPEPGQEAGGVITSSVAGSLTGRPVDVLIIDDPHKDAKEAGSEVMQENIREWWRTAASTRMPAGGGIVIVVQTRWHEMDLAGFLMSPDNDGHEEWHLINIPAQAVHDPAKGEECKCGQAVVAGQVQMVCLGGDILGRKPGEYMVSARGRGKADWESRKRNAGTQGWTSLYQGWPSPADGMIFKRDWWRYYTQPRAVEKDDGTWWALGTTQVIMSVDCAFKDTDGSDYVVILVVARRGPKVWLLDIHRERMAFDVTLDAIRQMAAKWPQATLKLIEDKANGPAVIQVLSKEIGGILPYSPTDSKLARAHAVSPFVEAGDVELPKAALAPWVGSFVHECAAFPNSTHDDQVDAFTQALIRLLLLGGGAAAFLAELQAEERTPDSGQAVPDSTYWSTTRQDDGETEHAGPAPAFAI